MSKNRAVALRELKKAKVLEAQAAQTQGALEALEAQSDMLEQTALHREVAAAIGESAKTLKKDKKLLSKAEDAVEAAGDMRDLHADITSVMGELGEQTRCEYDDDELLAELEGMVHQQQQQFEPVGEASADEQTAESVRRAAADLERRHAAYDEAETLRRGLPTAPTQIKQAETETQGLLQSVQS